MDTGSKDPADTGPEGIAPEDTAVQMDIAPEGKAWLEPTAEKAGSEPQCAIGTYGVR